MRRDGRRPRIPDAELEQYVLGELSGDEMAEARRILDEDEESRSRLAALERSNREILGRYPADLMSRRIRARLDGEIREHSPNPLLRPWPLAACLGGIALLLVLVALPDSSTAPGEPGTALRIKGGGGPVLTLHRRTRDGSEPLAAGAPACPGDVIRIGYRAAGRPYGVIVSVDARGQATLHLPEEGRLSARLKNDGQVLLDFALVLDDAPRWERFYFVTAGAPFDVTPVLEAATRIDLEAAVDRPDPLDLPADLEQFVISLEKRAKC